MEKLMKKIITGTAIIFVLLSSSLILSAENKEPNDDSNKRLDVTKLTKGGASSFEGDPDPELHGKLHEQWLKTQKQVHSPSGKLLSGKSEPVSGKGMGALLSTNTNKNKYQGVSVLPSGENKNPQ